jgi:hypothetical protein
MDTKIVEINAYTASILPGAQSLADASDKLFDSYKSIADDYGLCCGVYTSLGASDDDYGSYAIGQVSLSPSSLALISPPTQLESPDGLHLHQSHQLSQRTQLRV